MKKILVAIGLYYTVLSQNANAQIKIGPHAGKVDSSYSGVKTLQIDEINFVANYYNQDGNNSAVTGGIGTEKLFNVANALDLKFSFKDKKQRLNTLLLDAPFDYYSSASSDNVDPRTTSGASKTDLHFYPTVSLSQKDEKNHYSRGLSLSYSTEWDYTSYGGNLNFTKYLNNNNTELSFKAGAFIDTWDVILPIELRTRFDGSQATKPRNSYTVGVGLSQVVNARLQVMFMVEPAYQEGLLSTPFHRVYFSDNSMKVEKLPGTRLKIPASIRANYFLGDRIILRSFYRFYADDWGMVAHTASLETSVKVNSFFSITPHFRYNTQSAVKYFSPYKTHKTTDAFYSSDYDISAFDSYFYGAGIRMAPPGGILGIRSWNTLEIRYGRYSRTTALTANSITLSTKIK